MFSIHIIHLDINFYHLWLQVWAEGGMLLVMRKSLWIARSVLKTSHSSNKWTIWIYICVGKGKWTHLSNLIVLVIRMSCWSPKVYTSPKEAAMLSVWEKALAHGSLWKVTSLKFTGVKKTSASLFAPLFVHPCPSHICLSDVLWYPPRLWLCPAACLSVCMQHQVRETHGTWDCKGEKHAHLFCIKRKTKIL